MLGDNISQTFDFQQQESNETYEFTDFPANVIIDILASCELSHYPVLSIVCHTFHDYLCKHPQHAQKYWHTLLTGDNTHEIKNKVLKIAVKNSNYHLMRILIDAGADPNSRIEVINGKIGEGGYISIMPLLHVAYSNFDFFKKILALNKFDLESRFDEQTVLLRAIAEDDLERVRIVINAGASTDYDVSNDYKLSTKWYMLGRDYRKSQYLSYRLFSDQKFEILIALIMGANINLEYQLSGRETLLSVAVKNGNALNQSVVKELVKAGAIVSSASPQYIASELPVFNAYMDEKFDIFCMLINSNTCNINQEIKSRNFPYPQTMLAIATIEGEFKYAYALIDAGANVDQMMDQYSGRSILHYCAEKNLVDLAQRLLKKRANINVTNKDYFSRLSPLSVAIEHKSMDVIALFLKQQELDVNEKYLSILVNKLPIHIAAESGLVDVMRDLIKKGADISMRDREGYTALHYAALNGQFEAFMFLIDCGADVHARFVNDHLSILHDAVQGGNINIIKYLAEECNILPDSVEEHVPLFRFGYHLMHVHDNKSDVVEILDYLYSKGADIYGVDKKDGKTEVARIISEYGCRNTENLDYNPFAYILDKKIDLNRPVSPEGMFPLHVAAGNKYKPLQTTRLILEQSETIDAKDTFGQTSLFHAVIARNFEVVDLLLGAGANIDVHLLNGCSVFKSVIDAIFSNLLYTSVNLQSYSNHQDKFAIANLLINNDASEYENIPELLPLICVLQSPISNKANNEENKKLISNKVKVWLRDKYGYDELKNKAPTGITIQIFRKLVLFLLSRGARITEPDMQYLEYLTQAAHVPGMSQLANMLIEEINILKDYSHGDIAISQLTQLCYDETIKTESHYEHILKIFLVNSTDRDNPINVHNYIQTYFVKGIEHIGIFNAVKLFNEIVENHKSSLNINPEPTMPQRTEGSFFFKVQMNPWIDAWKSIREAVFQQWLSEVTSVSCENKHALIDLFDGANDPSHHQFKLIAQRRTDGEPGSKTYNKVAKVIEGLKYQSTPSHN